MPKIPYRVIYCPGKTHIRNKILFVLGGDIGADKIFVQCSDKECKWSSENKGWYEVSKNESGGYILRPTPTDYHFSLEQIPVVIMKAREV